MTSKAFVRVALLGAAIVLAGGMFLALRPASAGPAPQQGIFDVTAGENSYVLYHRQTGTAWILFPDPKAKRPAWVPIRRLTSEAELQSWRMNGQK